MLHATESALDRFCRVTRATRRHARRAAGRAVDRLRRIDRGPRRSAERWCLAGAAACFAWVGWVWIDGALWQERQMARLAAAAEAVPAVAAADAAHRGSSLSEPEVSPGLPPVELSADAPRWERAAYRPEPAERSAGRAGTAAVPPSSTPAASGPVPKPAPPVPAGSDGVPELPGETAPPELPGEAPPATRTGGSPPPPAAVPGVLGELSVPRLGLSWAVAEGVAAATLRRAPGWIPGTARPGAPGNVGIAGHRDRHFRRLEDVAVGDELVLATPAGPRRYRVDWARVVSPKDVGVLAPTGADSVTLVTCYPFRWLGPAPDRYVVRAVAVDATPTVTPREASDLSG